MKYLYAGSLFGLINTEILCRSPGKFIRLLKSAIQFVT